MGSAVGAAKLELITAQGKAMFLTKVLEYCGKKKAPSKSPPVGET
jgi:hypothetical protein